MKAKEINKKELIKEEPICKIKTLRELAEEQNSKFAKEMLENPILTENEIKELAKNQFPFFTLASVLKYEDIIGTNALFKSMEVMLQNIDVCICKTCTDKYAPGYCDRCRLGIAKKVAELELEHAKIGGEKI